MLVAQAFISYARANVCPQLSDEAAQELQDSYVRMRRIGQTHNRSVITATSAASMNVLLSTIPNRILQAASTRVAHSSVGSIGQDASVGSRHPR